MHPSVYFVEIFLAPVTYKRGVTQLEYTSHGRSRTLQCLCILVLHQDQILPLTICVALFLLSFHLGIAFLSLNIG